MSLEPPGIDDATRILGLHRVLPMAYRGEDLTPLWQDRAARVAAGENRAAALMDMSLILQSLSRTEEALALMHEALALQRSYCVVHGDGSGVRLLAFVTAGDLMANTPVDFLLNGSNAVLWLHYVDERTEALGALPAHDVAMVTIGEAVTHPPILARLDALLRDHDGPVLNRDTRSIGALTRDGVSAMLANEPAILAPRTDRLDRATLEAMVSPAAGKGAEGSPVFPFIIRPIGTHAGFGLDRVTGVDELRAYLAAEPAPAFFVAPFIDYRDADGLYAKQRIVFVQGKAFPSHLALSGHWMVHYLSAGMDADAGKRRVEAEWMRTFDTDFGVRHADAFAALHRATGLDYFGIDSAETADGRLLVFEMDVAMVVHDMDDPAVFPYKPPAMRRLFDAFVTMAETGVMNAAR